MTDLRAVLLSLPLLVATAARAEAPAGTAPAAPEQAPAAAPAPATSPPAPGGQDRVGLGVSIGQGGAGPALYVPFDRGGVRVELEGAFLKATDGAADASVVRLGVGAFSLMDTSAATRAYLGARVQYLRVQDTGFLSQGVRLAAVLAAEWAPVPGAAVGVEGQLGYTGGDHARPITPGNAAGGIDTTALLFVRVFLAAAERGDGARATPGGAAAVGAPVSTPPAARPPAAAPTRCRASSDCQGLAICYDGVCRR